MTSTITRPQAEAPTTLRATYSLLAVLTDALSSIEDQEPDQFHSGTPAGTALLSLSAIARRAVAALGADPGVHLTDGPGVVVVRDLVTATRLLARTASRPPAEGTDVPFLLTAAEGVRATLQETMTTAA